MDVGALVKELRSSNLPVEITIFGDTYQSSNGQKVAYICYPVIQFGKKIIGVDSLKETTSIYDLGKIPYEEIASATLVVVGRAIEFSESLQNSGVSATINFVNKLESNLRI